MAVDPASLQERSSVVPRSELEMTDTESMSDVAEIDGEIEAILNE